MSAVCGTVYAGYSVWALGENVKDLNVQQTCLAATGMEMCGSNERGSEGTLDNYKLSVEEALLAVPLAPLEIAFGISEIRRISQGVFLTSDAKSA